MKLFLCMNVTKLLLLYKFEKLLNLLTIYLSYCLISRLYLWYIVPLLRKNLGLFLKLCFSHINMPEKFEHHLLNILTFIIHAWDIMLSFAIFVLEEICNIWSSSLDMLLVRMRTSYGKSFTCSTSHIKVQMNMHVHI